MARGGRQVFAKVPKSAASPARRRGRSFCHAATATEVTPTLLFANFFFPFFFFLIWTTCQFRGCKWKVKSTAMEQWKVERSLVFPSGLIVSTNMVYEPAPLLHTSRSFFPQRPPPLFFLFIILLLSLYDFAPIKVRPWCLYTHTHAVQWYVQGTKYFMPRTFLLISKAFLRFLQPQPPEDDAKWNMAHAPCCGSFIPSLSI